MGRRRGAMNWSQENCLIDGHRLPCERREGDLRLVPDDPHLCGVVSAAILCAVTLHAARQGYFAVSSLIDRKRLLLFANVQDAELPFPLASDVCSANLQLP